MAKVKFIPLFERSLKEQAGMVRARVVEVKRDNLRRGFYNLYRNELCTSNDLFIRHYRDRRELVKVDAASGSTITLRVL